MRVDAAGFWVGFFVAPQDATGRARVRAVFDHLSFVPTAAVQVG